MNQGIQHLFLRRLRCIAGCTLLGLTFGTLQDAHACSCYFPPEYGYGDRYQDAEQALFGRVLLKFELVQDVLYAVMPDMDVKGCLAQANQVVWIRSAMTPAQCGVDLQAGRRYLFHLHGQDEDGLYPLNLCGFYKNPEDLSRAQLLHAVSQAPACGQARSL